MRTDIRRLSGSCCDDEKSGTAAKESTCILDEVLWRHFVVLDFLAPKTRL